MAFETRWFSEAALKCVSQGKFELKIKPEVLFGGAILVSMQYWEGLLFYRPVFDHKNAHQINDVQGTVEI